MPSIYAVQIPKFPVFKVGFWKGGDVELWSRYRTPYGKDIHITLWECEALQDEKKTHADLAMFADSSSAELYKVEHLQAVIDHLDATFGPSRAFDILEYRRQKA